MAEFEPSGHLTLPKPDLPPPLKTPEERKNYLLEQVENVEGARVLCDVPIPLKGETPAAAQQRLYKVFLMRHGAALGALGFALRTQMIEPELYAQLTNRIRATLMPTQAGQVTKVKEPPR